MKIKFKDILSFIPLFPNLSRIKKEDEEGLLYKLNYKGDYYKLLPVLEGIFKAGCTVFCHKNYDGDTLLGRNFDLRHFYKNENGETEITGLIVVIKTNNKKVKYKSIGVCDAIYLDPSCKIFHKGSLSKKDKNSFRALMLPFLTMDGVNEKGLAVSVLHLNTDNSFEEIEYKDPSLFNEEETKNLILLTNPGEVPDKMNGRLTKWNIIENTIDKKVWKVIKDKATFQVDPTKKTVIHTVLMRMMLDNCKDCDEAIELAKSVNMISTPDSDNHIVINDASGKSYCLEWIKNELVVKEAYHVSNFYNNREDHFGYGYNRDEVLSKAINDNPNGFSEEDCMKALEGASQNFLKGKDHGFTQWSAVYNLNKQTLNLALHSNYSKIYKYSLNK